MQKIWADWAVGELGADDCHAHKNIIRLVCADMANLTVLSIAAVSFEMAVCCGG